MSKGDIRIVDLGGRNVTPVRRFFVKSGKGAIAAGEPVKFVPTGIATAGDGLYVVPLIDGEPTVTGSAYFLGLAANAATHTSSANGTVDVYLDLPGTIYGASPKTAGTANTQAEIDSYQFYRIVIDLTSSKFTADLAADDKTFGFIVVGGDPLRDEVHFVCQEQASWRSISRAAALQ